MKTQTATPALSARWLGLSIILLGLLSPVRLLAGGSWSAVNQYAPDQVWLMLLLSDGRILCENNPQGPDGEGPQQTGNKQWFLLTPDDYGSYANANWSYAQSANNPRLFFASQVLTNGQVFVAGGEYGSGGTNAEIYDPVTNRWTVTPNTPGPCAFLDAISETLPNGNVLLAPVNPTTYGDTLIWNTAANTWSNGPTLYKVEDQSEVSWVKLADGSILTYDPLDRAGSNGTNSQRYIPSLNQWIPDANVPIQMSVNLLAGGAVGETGPGFLLPNGKAFFLGGTGHTVIYTPAQLGGTNQGSWVQGPDIPAGLVSADAPACMMANGKILCNFAGPVTTNGGSVNFPSGLSFYEYDYTAGATGSFTPVSSPPESGNFATFETIMLALPDGTVLYSQVEQGGGPFDDDETTLYIYTPDGSPLAAGKPAIRSITSNPDGSYHLVGTGLNGISEGAAFGDDAQMNSNYPLVRMTNSATGNVYYARTYNWSSTGVQTGTNLVTTEFSLPQTLPSGVYSLVVVANGNASDPVTFYGPVWVNFDFYSALDFYFGSQDFPYNTLASGVANVASGGTVAIASSSVVSAETMKIAKAMQIISVGGPSTIGR